MRHGVKNKKNSKIVDIFSKKCDFLIKFCDNSQYFSKITHKKYFDIGLYFFKKDSQTYLKIFDGNGLRACSFVTNIFDFFFSLSKTEFKKQAKQIEKMYEQLDVKTLLVQKID